MIVSASSNRPTRWSNGWPKARNSVSFQPAPMPSISQPPLISSIVSAILASSAGRRNAVQATIGPSSTRRVTAASVSAGRHNPHIRAFYERLRAAGKPVKVARCAAARKLLHLCWAVVTRDIDYDPHYGAGTP